MTFENPSSMTTTAELTPATAAHYQAILEAALLTADQPLNIEQLEQLFSQDPQPLSRSQIRACLKQLQQQMSARGIELVEVASGFRFQVKSQLHPWLKQLIRQRPPRYSRALLETLAIIVYRQPITRSEIEKIRGVSVSTNIIRTLQDYQWIRVLAHRDSPGRPALYGTTKAFLDHFNLKHLNELPTLNELQHLELQPDLPETEDESALDAPHPLTSAAHSATSTSKP